jgi:tetratricopeptide (TPR) repeat protein
MENKMIAKRLKKAEDSFTRREYEEALSMYSNILRKNPASQEARLGAILSDMASENESEAQALFDYYTVVKHESPENAQNIIEGLIRSFDGNSEEISALLNSLSSSKIDDIDGISYEDFQMVVKECNSFKEAFENIIFSTKIIITEKSEFYSFIHDLITHEYYEIALNYLESAANEFTHDDKIRELFIKLRAIISDNTSKQ